MEDKFTNFIEYQKFVNRLSINLLEEINNSVKKEFMSEFTDLKEEIKSTLEKISTVTSREIKSYDAISGMLISLDHKLETIDKYVSENISKSIYITRQINSSKYNNLSLIQEWFVDFIVFTTSRMTNKSEKIILDYILQLLEEDIWKNGKDKSIRYISFEERAERGINILMSIKKKFNIANCSYGTLLAIHQIFLSMIFHKNPIDYPMIDFVGNELSEYYKCQKSPISSIIHKETESLINLLDDQINSDLYPIIHKETDGGSEIDSSSSSDSN